MSGTHRSRLRHVGKPRPSSRILRGKGRERDRTRRGSPSRWRDVFGIPRHQGRDNMIRTAGPHRRGCRAGPCGRGKCRDSRSDVQTVPWTALASFTGAGRARSLKVLTRSCYRTRARHVRRAPPRSRGTCKDRRAAGATGPAGPSPAGPAGPTTAGPGGLNVTVATDTQGNIGTQYDWADARCPASAPYVLSGEAVSTAGPLTASEPYDFTTGTPVTGAEVSGDVYGWRMVIPQGSQSTAANGGMTVYAVCSA